MNRLDKLVVFHPLKRAELEAVLDIELGLVQKRVLDTATGKFLFRVTDAGREFLLREGTDQRYGARHLKRAIERHLVYPLANLLATQQVRIGDLVRVDWDGQHDQLTFVREREGAIVAPETSGTEATAVTEGSDGLGKAPRRKLFRRKRPTHRLFPRRLVRPSLASRCKAEKKTADRLCLTAASAIPVFRKFRRAGAVPPAPSRNSPTPSHDAASYQPGRFAASYERAIRT